MASDKPGNQNRLTWVLFILYLLALTWMVLFKLQFSAPVMEGGRIVNLVPIVGSLGENGAIRFGEIRNNIIAFVPLGLFLCMLTGEWSFGKKTLALLLLPAVYEAAQYIFAIGRADITDVLSNTLGGIIGVFVYALLRRCLKDQTNRVINLAAAAIALMACSLIVYLMANHRWVRFQ